MEGKKRGWENRDFFASCLGKNSVLLVAWYSNLQPLRRLVVDRCSWSREEMAQELIVAQGAKLAS